MLDGKLTWEDVRALRDQWPGKFVVKGILRADDAVRAVDLGADAVVVSNHGGRNLDSAAVPLEVLPDVAAAVGSRAGIFIDGGIQRGSDIAKALVLGASGVLVGRAALYGLAVGGRAGAEHALAILHRELLYTMAMLGCPTVSGLDQSFLHEPGLRAWAGREFDRPRRSDGPMAAPEAAGLRYDRAGSGDRR